MSGSETTDMTEASTGSVSVLERFRQLSREKEKQHLDGVSGSQGPITAVYLNNESTTSEKSDDTQKCISRDLEHDLEKKRFYGDKRLHEDNRQCQDDKKRKVIHIGLQEKDVGITEYVCNDHPGFKGIIKQRFTDFQVNEIDIDGNVVKLTSTELPPPPPPENIEQKLSEEHSGILNSEDWKKLVEIYENKVEGKVFSIDVTDMDKSNRSRLHNDVKSRFDYHMYSNTVDRDGRKMVEIGYTLRSRERRRWPSGRPEYLHFVVHKENADTTETVHMLAYKLRIKPSKFSYAGTKDRRGITSQLMSLRKISAESLLKLGYMRGVRVGNFVYKNKSLRLGHLRGNHFRIAVRCVDVEDEIIQKAVVSLEEFGFINYFGLQRFGTSQVAPTHVIGKALLQDDFKQAVELILKPRPGERTYLDVERAREVWWETRDAKKALKCLRRSEKAVEHKILLGLAKNGPNAYVNALECLPRNSLMLYLHAYQSELWNTVVSRRIKKYGLKPVPGDLVYQNPDGDKNNLGTDYIATGHASDSAEGQSDNEDDQQSDNLHAAGNVPTNSHTKIVRKLSQSEVDTITIEKVVYPLLGYGVELPDSEIAGWYMDHLKEDGLTIDMFKKNTKLFSINGSYRSMIAKPWDVRWHTMRYSEQNADLILTDSDEMTGRSPIESVPDGQYKALILELSLKPAVYATMVLRELLKCETSTSHQALLTQYNLEVGQEKEQRENIKTEGTEDISNCKLDIKTELD